MLEKGKIIDKRVIKIKIYSWFAELIEILALR